MIIRLHRCDRPPALSRSSSAAFADAYATDRGPRLLDAVKAGDREAVRAAAEAAGRTDGHRARRDHGSPLGRARRRSRDRTHAASCRRRSERGHARGHHAARAGGDQRQPGRDGASARGGREPERRAAGGRNGPDDGGAHGQARGAEGPASTRRRPEGARELVRRDAR